MEFSATNSQIFIGIPIFNPDIALLDDLIGGIISSQIKITISFDPFSEFDSLDFITRYGSHEFIEIIVSKIGGVWQNHLHLINACKSRYIYFLHQDDYVEFESLFAAFEIWANKVGVGSLSFSKDVGTIRPRHEFVQVLPGLLTRLKVGENVDFNRIGNRLGPPSMNIYEVSGLKSVPFSGSASMDMVWNACFLQGGMVTAWEGNSFIRLGNPVNRDGRLASVQTGLERLEESVSILRSHIKYWNFATFYRCSICGLLRAVVGKVIHNRKLRLSDFKIMLRLVANYAISLCR